MYFAQSSALMRFSFFGSAGCHVTNTTTHTHTATQAHTQPHKQPHAHVSSCGATAMVVSMHTYLAHDFTDRAGCRVGLPVSEHWPGAYHRHLHVAVAHLHAQGVEEALHGVLRG